MMPLMTNQNSPLDAHGVADLTYEEFRRKLADPRVRVANALSRDQFAAGHIPGSLAAPLDELATRAAEFFPDKEAEIVFYCGGPA